MTSVTSINATRQLCADLDHLIDSEKAALPFFALSLIERARADLQAFLDEMERTEVPKTQLSKVWLMRK